MIQSDHALFRALRVARKALNAERNLPRQVQFRVPAPSPRHFWIEICARSFFPRWVFVMIAGDETIDEILHGKAKIIQKRRGYRFSLDPILLSHFVEVRKNHRIVDLGTGVGVIAVLLAKRAPTVSVAGVEVQTELSECARKNVVLNGLSGRVEIVTDTVQNIAGVLAAESFDLAVANPPYRGRESGRMNPDEQKMAARHETLGDLGDFLKAAAYLLKPGGKAAFIFTASRSAELFSRMAFFRLEPKRVRFIHPRPDQNASMALVEGVKGGRVGTKILPPLVVYQSGRLYADEVASILAGGWFCPEPKFP